MCGGEYFFDFIFFFFSSRRRHTRFDCDWSSDVCSSDLAKGQVIGSSPAFRRTMTLVEQVADSSATVLIQGESGAGKERFARAIHDLSARGSGPFVAVNCAAIPETLIESELFGYERGAFTGAAVR